MGNSNITNSGFNLTGAGTSWGANKAFSGGGAATYNSNQAAPFLGGCVTHIKSLSVDAFEAKYISAGKIKSDYIEVTNENITGTLTVNKIRSKDALYTTNWGDLSYVSSERKGLFSSVDRPMISVLKLARSKTTTSLFI